MKIVIKKPARDPGAGPRFSSCFPQQIAVMGCRPGVSTVSVAGLILCVINGATCYQLSVSDSSGLRTALNDVQADTIVLTQSIQIVNTTGSPWTTYFLTRNLLLTGNVSCVLDFNLVPELIVVQPGFQLSFQNLFVRGSLRSANIDNSLIGQYSRYKTAVSIAWPSIVFLPGSNISYNGTTSLGKVGQTATQQGQFFKKAGLGNNVTFPDNITLAIQGLWPRNVTIQDLKTNQTVGSGFIVLENVVAIFPPDDGVSPMPGPSTANSFPHQRPPPPPRLNWWQGFMIGVFGTATIMTLIFIGILHLYKRRLHRQFRSFSEEIPQSLSTKSSTKSSQG